MKYKKLVGLYKKIENTPSTLDKVKILSDFLKKTKSEDLAQIVLLIQGYSFPEYDPRQIGIGTKIAIRALASSCGVSIDKVNSEWERVGDLGVAASKLIKTKKQSTLFSKSLSSSKVLKNMKKLAELSGTGTVNRKISLLRELFSFSDAESSKYIIRTCLQDLRIGVGAGTMRDGISQAFNVSKKKVQRAYDLTVDFAEVAKIAKKRGNKGLSKAKIKIGRPIKVMLYQKTKNMREGFEKVGTPAAIEFKYDGFRLTIHRKNEKIWLFTRRQEDVTKQFPDVVEEVKKHVKSKNFILDSEIIGIDKKTGSWLPFQKISQRIKRKYNIKRTIKEIPVIVRIFDVLCFNGKNLINKPFRERRMVISKNVKQTKNKLGLAKHIITSSEKKAKAFYKKALKKNCEGVMLKNLDAEYKPGSRVGYGVKVKPVMESLDLVIVGAEWGTGKRGKWLSSFKLGAFNEKKQDFQCVGKLGTGIKEKKGLGISFLELTQMLKPLIISKKGRSVKVKPSIVLEVGYEEIQKSPTYSSGLALRFPRLIKLRNDRSPREISTLKRVRELYKKQR